MIIFAKYNADDRRALIEECLERYLETMQKTKTGESTVERPPCSKPYFKDYPDIRFSVSHSDNLTVVAMSDTEVGVDIEAIRERDFQKVADRHFTDGERAEVSDLTSFLRVWTKKEAFLKFTGEGLSGLGTSDVSAQIVFEGKPLKFTSLDIFEGFVGAVVAWEQPLIFIQLD